MSEAGPSDPHPRPLRRGPALLISAVIVAATVWPALRDPPRDSFPLSTYPMFSVARGPGWLHVVVGYDAAGNQHPIAPRYIANLEVMQAAETIRKAVRRRRAKQLCEEVAARIAKTDALPQLVRLEVQSRRFDPRTYFVSPEGSHPQKLRRRARCRIPREGVS